MPSFEYRSSLVDLEKAPDEICRLLEIWNQHKPALGHPLKNEMNPSDYKDFLGRICVIEIQQDPLDFIYRLDGTEISAASNEDLYGKSILNGTPKEIYQHHYEEFQTTFKASAPNLWEIFYDTGEKFNYYRLILPYAKDGNTKDNNTGHQPPGYFITYCYSLISPDGGFDTFRQVSSYR